MFKKPAELANAKMSVIGADMVVAGNIKAKEAVRVEGIVEGGVETEGAVTIAKTAKVTGDVLGSDVTVGGELAGNIVSGGKTEVTSTGKVFGDIETKTLIVDEHAVFQGKCVMTGAEAAPQAGEQRPACVPEGPQTHGCWDEAPKRVD